MKWPWLVVASFPLCLSACDLWSYSHPTSSSGQVVDARRDGADEQSTGTVDSATWDAERDGAVTVDGTTVDRTTVDRTTVDRTTVDGTTVDGTIDAAAIDRPGSMDQDDVDASVDAPTGNIGDAALIPDAHACEVLPVEINRDAMYQISPNPDPPLNRCGETTCTLDPKGGLRMDYCLAGCGGSSSPWAVCVFAGPVDMRAFDADYESSFFLEVEFEVLSGTLAGKLNLYYGHDPGRKFLPLVAANEALPVGTYVRTFAPEQAAFPAWDGIPVACWNRCGSCDSAKTAGTFSFGDADLSLAAEGCAGRVDGHVHLVAVRLVPVTCACNRSDECPAERPECLVPEAASDACSWPASRAPGVCGIPSACAASDRLGTPCTTTTPVCGGTWRCLDDRLACVVDTCDSPDGG